MTPFIGGNEPGEQAVKQAIVYHGDGTAEKVLILYGSQIENDQSKKRHYRITQIYMIASIVAIIITSSIALIQIKKLKI